jgi:hypothetical protein
MSENQIEKLEAMRDRLRAQLDGVNSCISLLREGEEKVLEEVPVMQNRLPFVGKTSPKSDTNGHGSLYMIPRAQLVDIMKDAVKRGGLTALKALALYARHCKDKTFDDMQEMGTVMIESGVSSAKSWHNAVANMYNIANRPGSSVRKIAPGKFKLFE